MSTFDAHTSQASALQDLAFFVGSWKANGTFFATSASPEKAIEMNIQGVQELENNWLILRTEENVTPENPHPLSAIYIWGYDLTSRQFLASWFDSHGGRATQTSSGWDGERLVFVGEMTVAGQTFPLTADGPRLRVVPKTRSGTVRGIPSRLRIRLSTLAL